MWTYCAILFVGCSGSTMDAIVLADVAILVDAVEPLDAIVKLLRHNCCHKTIIAPLGAVVIRGRGPPWWWLGM